MPSLSTSGLVKDSSGVFMTNSAAVTKPAKQEEFPLAASPRVVAVNFLEKAGLPRPRSKLCSDSMSTVQEIKSAIAKLSLEEQAELISELCGKVDDDWDRQMKIDSAAGKFAALNHDAEAAHASGQTRPLEDIPGEP